MSHTMEGVPASVGGRASAHSSEVRIYGWEEMGQGQEGLRCVQGAPAFACCKKMGYV